MVTKEELDQLFDKEDRLAERAGNAEERLFDKVYWDIKKYPMNEDKITNLFKKAQELINTEMTKTATKIKTVDPKNTQKKTEIQIKSLEKQIKIYYEYMGKIDDLN